METEKMVSELTHESIRQDAKHEKAHRRKVAECSHIHDVVDNLSLDEAELDDGSVGVAVPAVCDNCRKDCGHALYYASFKEDEFPIIHYESDYSYNLVEFIPTDDGYEMTVRYTGIWFTFKQTFDTIRES